MQSPYINFNDKTLKIVRVYSGNDGHAQIEDITVSSEAMGPNGIEQFLMKQAHAYAVFSCPPAHEIAERNVLPRVPELFYFISGEADIRTHKNSMHAHRGTLIIFENSKGTGHRIKSGPAGFIAIKMLLAG